MGGTASNQDDYPYFVQVQGDEGACDGGTVIADSRVLNRRALSGLDDPNNPIYVHVSNSSAWWPAIELFAHPLWDWRDSSHGHDLALIHVADGALAGIPAVQVGAPRDAGAYAPGRPATIMGYGSVDGSRAGSLTFMVANSLLRSDSAMHDTWTTGTTSC